MFLWNGIGIDPNNPPWQWQVWRGSEFGWEAVSIVSDKTVNRVGVEKMPPDLRLKAMAKTGKN